MGIQWRAVFCGLFYLVGVVVMLKLVEGMVFAPLNYDSRAVGFFLSYDEYRLQGYGPVMLAGYFLIHIVKIGIPSYVAAQLAGRARVLHAWLVVGIAYLFAWPVFGSLAQQPTSELIGLVFSLSVAYLAAKLSGIRTRPYR